MVVTEAKRHQLYEKLQEKLGREEAYTMMDLLPPTGWEDVARQSDLLVMKSGMTAMRADLSAVEAGLGARIEVLEHKIDHGFAAMAMQFSAVDAKFEAVDSKFEGIDGRFEAIDAKFDAMDAKFDAMDAKFDAKISAVHSDLKGALHSELRRMAFALIAAYSTIGGLIISAVAVLG